MTGSILGERVLRKEDPKFLTTGGVYVDDMDEPMLEGGLHVTYARSTMAHARITGIDTSAAEASPGVVAIYTAADLGLEPVPAAFNPMVARPLLAHEVVRYVGEPVAAVVTQRRDQGEDAAELVEVDYEPLEVLAGRRDLGGQQHAPVPERRQQRGVRLDRARHARHDRRLVLRGLRRRRQPTTGQPARRPLPPRGARVGRGMGRRPAAPMAVDAARARARDQSITAANGVEPDQVRIITPDVGGGFGAKIGAYPEELLLGRLAKELGRPVLLAGDPQRVHGRPRPRPGPGAAHHHRRHPGRQGPRLPPARAAGLRCVRRGRHRPGRRDDAAHVVGRVRHPEDRVPHHLRRHQHHAGRGLPGGRAAGGDRGGRAGDGPVRGRDRDGPGRPSPGQPDPQVRRAPHHRHRPDLRRRRLRGRARQGARRGRLRRAARASRPSAARAADPASSGSASASTSRSRAARRSCTRRPASRSSTTGGPSSTRAPRRTGRATSRPGR